MNLASAIAASTIPARASAPSGLRFGASRDGDLTSDVLGGFAEIALCRRLDAVGAGTEIDAVEVELENFVLGVLALQPQRQFHFLQLARHGAFLGQEQVFGELLRQRRAALRYAAMHDVGDGRARDADGVDAVMRIEAAVLDGDERLRQIGRQILQRDIGAGHFAARGQYAAVDTDDLDGRRALWNFQRLDRRQMCADPDHDADDRDRSPQAEHRAPIDQPADPDPAARFRAPLGAASRRARLALARRRLVVVLFVLAPGHWFLWFFFVDGGWDAILR
jgi:hypothetical protein